MTRYLSIRPRMRLDFGVELMGKPRQCKGRTKAGKRCKAHPLHDTDFCISHSDRATQASLGFGGSENGRIGGYSRRVPKLRELLTAEVEERAEEIIEKLFKGLTAERAVVVGTGPKAHVEIVPDDELVLKTVREIFDRADGRPTQRVEAESEVRVYAEEQIEERVNRLVENVRQRSRMNGNGTHASRRRRAASTG